MDSVITIITNNPRVRVHYESAPADRIQIVFMDSRADVFVTVRNYIHKHYALINHAMAGNIPIHKHPYRSMALRKSPQLDTKSLILWEQAIERVNRAPLPPYPDDILADFQEMDFLLFSENFRY